MTVEELQEIADGISLALHREHEVFVREEESGNSIVIPGWGFELVLEIGEAGSILGYISDTSG